ncbi:MAG TPA: ribonuclease D [Thioalkalivibrio sp.]|nr:ribonuclease D [Thioalkalivibrio sp.]
MSDIRYIDDAEALAAFCNELRGVDWLALDTEFIREKTYYPRLCLVQIGTAETIACIDPLAIDDLTPLFALLNDPATLKVLHAAHQDLEIFHLLSGQVPTPIFDTQVAAAVLGQGEQIGYGKLVQNALGLELDKSHARTDWAQRPLDADQLNYAADDVRYLAQIYPQMRDTLTELGRLDWLDEDFAEISDSSRFVIDPDAMWRKIKGVQFLKGAQLAVLQVLAAWREHQAMEKDKPRRWILSDDVLIDLARRMPADEKGLAKIRGLEPRTVERHGQTLLKLIEEGRARPKGEWPELKLRDRLPPEQEPLADAAMAVLRQSALDTEISPGAIASRKDVEAVILGDTDNALLHGWRGKLAGRAIRAFLDGELKLATEGGRLTMKP